MTRWQTIKHNGRRTEKLDEVQSDWGTLDSTNDPTAIDDSDSPDTLNTSYDFGVPEKAPGYIRLTTAVLPGPVTFEKEFYKQDGTKQFIFAVTANNTATAPGTNPPGVANAALAAGSGLGIGVYRYKITFVTAAGETQGGTEFTITTTSGNQQVALTNIPVNLSPTVTSRKIYRTVVGGATNTEKLVTTIADNTTTSYTDVLVDGSLGANVPTVNTAGGATGSYLYRYDNAGGGILLGGPFNINGIWDCDVYGDKLWMVDQFDPMQVWDGSTLTVLSPANGQIFAYVRQRKNRMYGVPRNSSLLFFTDAGDATSWPVNSFIKVNTQDGEIITGLGATEDMLAITKTDSVHVIQGEPLGAGATTTIGNLQLHRADSEVGCISHRSIQNIGSGIFLFASEFGIHALQNLTVTNVSPRLQTTFANDFSPSNRSKCWSIYSRTRKVYMFGYTSIGATTPDKAIYMDMHVPNRTRYSIWDDIPGSYAIEFRFNETTSVYLGDPNRGIIYQLFQGYAHIAGDNGKAIGTSSTTTLQDTTKSWAVNQFKDCKVKIFGGTGKDQAAVVVSNTSNTLTFSPAMAIAPNASSEYSIGYYDGYWKTKISDFHKQNLSKKYKNYNVYCDSEGNYSLLFGIAFGTNPVRYTDALSLQASSGVLTWGQLNTDGSHIPWGLAGARFGHSKKIWRQGDSSGTDRFWQGMFGTNRANQPWRVASTSITYKEKKGRPD